VCSVVRFVASPDYAFPTDALVEPVPFFCSRALIGHQSAPFFTIQCRMILLTSIRPVLQLPYSGIVTGIDTGNGFTPSVFLFVHKADGRSFAKEPQMKVRSWSLSLLSMLLFALLAACGSQPAAPANQSSPPPTAAEASTAVPAPTIAEALPTPVPIPTPSSSTIGSGSTKIVWWHINTPEEQRAVWEQMANDFVAQNPNVSIEITVLENESFKAKLATTMQSGSPPDVFQSWGGGVLKQYGEAGLVQDLTSALGQEGWGATFSPGPLGLYTFDGKTYGVPWNAGMVGFWYNKALFEQAGITAPPATWAEFLETVKKLKEAGITPLALGGKDKWPGHFYWVYLATRLGGREAFEAAYSREGSFADAPFVQAGERLKELVDLQPFQVGFLGAGYGDHQVVMANGQAAMELMGQWAPGANGSVAEDPETYNANLGWFPFPAVEGGAGDPSDALGGGDGFAVGKNAPPEAIAFVRFLTSAENQRTLVKAGMAGTPAITAAADVIENSFLKEIFERAAQAKYYQLYYDQYLPPAVGQTVNDATQELFAGTASPEEVAGKIEESAAFELQP
jgi:raffinose/stachyose/melibiose transport system substrate-binding protein